MSSKYIQRLRAVRGEYEAAKQGIAYVNKKWDQYDIARDVSGVTPKDFRRVNEYLFATYLIRLSAEFEGILKYHLRSNHPGVPIPKDAKVDWLISKVSKQEDFKAGKNLRENLEKVRTYRNNFAHSGQLPPATFTFDSALSWFNTFLDRLPEPLT
jgi:hypothetical protein